MIDFKTLETAGKQAGTAFETLLEIYEKLPETVCRCDTIGVCCVSLPEMTAIEALLWCRAISEMPEGKRTLLLRNFVAFYLTHPIRRPGCPFRKEGSCSIYSKRPFACRAYGLWSPKTGRERTRENRKAQKALVDIWARFGVEIPVQDLVVEMDYCGDVATNAQEKISDRELIGLLESVYLLSKPISKVQQLFETHFQSDFSYLVAALMLGQKKAFLGKYAVIKEMVNKDAETRLEKFIKKVTSKSWQLNTSRWAG